MRQDVLDIPDHLRDALWRAETARLEPGQSAGLLICGMGGSAIGGELATAVLGDRFQRPMFTVRDYVLPRWVTPDFAILCSSFSGATEETIACFEAAGELGCRRIVASTGGPLTEAAREAGVPVIGLPGILAAPRMAVAYMVVTALEAAARTGVAPRMAAEIEQAAVELEGVREDLASEATRIAEAIGDQLPVVYGTGLTVPAARRMKSQINENAKRPAFAAELPEADHNEICAWGIGLDSDPGIPQAAVFLKDRDQHPRNQKRIELTAELIAEAGNTVARAETRGSNLLSRLMSAVMLGDLVSLELAAVDGVDPLPIPAIDRLKERLT